jgi:hypothetical protein
MTNSTGVITCNPSDFLALSKSRKLEVIMIAPAFIALSITKSSPASGEVGRQE